MTTHDSSVQANNLKHSKLRNFEGRYDPSKERLVCMGLMWRESCVARTGLRSIPEDKNKVDRPLSFVLGAKRMGHLIRQKQKIRKERSPMVVDRMACVVNHGPSNLSRRKYLFSLSALEQS